jgi:hypothetical protein
MKHILTACSTQSIVCGLAAPAARWPAEVQLEVAMGEGIKAHLFEFVHSVAN